MKLAPGLLLVSRYRIRHIVAEGGMSTIYKAVDTKTGNLVAVKELSNVDEDKELARENEQIFINEARILSKLAHRSIPRILDFFIENKNRYLIMEFVDGSDLHTILGKLGTFDEKTVMEWTCQLIEVLEYLHSRTPPVIFRDIKPSNIMLEPMGRIRLVDFGIARTYKPESYSDTVNLGSGGYAAPEQYAKAGRQTDMRSDIYSLGVTVHQLLTGIDPVAIGFKIPPPTSVRPELNSTWDSIILKAVQLEPDDRYSTLSEMKEELTTLVNRALSSEPASEAVSEPADSEKQEESSGKEKNEECAQASAGIEKGGLSVRKTSITILLVVLIIAALWASLHLCAAGEHFPAWMKIVLLAGGALWISLCGTAIYFVTKRSF
ncbi:MAG: serine/threonine protein kinase [Candidatus Xenobiia bacterium LiM19]